MLRAEGSDDKITKRSLCLHTKLLDNSRFLQTSKLELLVLRVSMAAGLIWGFLVCVAFNILFFPRHQRWDILERLWCHESEPFQGQVFPCSGEWSQLKGGTVRSMLLCWTLYTGVPCCLFNIWAICGCTDLLILLGVRKSHLRKATGSFSLPNWQFHLLLSILFMQLFCFLSSFGKRSAGSLRRGCECIVLEPSEMIVVSNQREPYWYSITSTKSSNYPAVIKCVFLGPGSGEFQPRFKLWPNFMAN